MNREIKFRAWDKEKKVLMPVKQMDWSEWWVSCNPIGVNEPLAFGERNSFNNEQTDRHIIMQYTGLKDRNGKQIYEGDILSAVRYGTNTPAGVNRWKVYYNEERLTYYWINQEGIKEPFWEFNLGSVQYIILGNIYENPELLEEKHE